MTAVLHGMFPAVLTIVFAILFCCLLFSWQGARSLQNIERGLDTLSKGEPVSLPVSGFTSDLAKKLNQTSAQLQKRNEIISRRDTARTNWIAGVSHDIRTPLSLILGWAEQLEHDTALSAKTQQKAQRIRIQSRKNPFSHRGFKSDQQIAVWSSAASLPFCHPRAIFTPHCCRIL